MVANFDWVRFESWERKNTLPREAGGPTLHDLSDHLPDAPAHGKFAGHFSHADLRQGTSIDTRPL
jgi:hypothetical protein